MSPRLHARPSALGVLLLILAPLTAGAQSMPRPKVTPPLATVRADSSVRATAPREAVPNFWKTKAERTNYRLTSDYDETLRYCKQIEAGSRWVKLDTYGTSGQGRALHVMILSKDRAFTPEAARASGKPVVLIQNGIHSGEIEGKDACLALMRDIAALRTRADLLDSVNLLILPIFSVDAHERRSRYNRINQNGPEEMGWRSTPLGLNLNRDYMKVETPEMRALIGNLYTKWWPELLIDDHTTDGADYRHDISYSFAHGAGVPAALDRWMVEAFEGRVVPALAAKGHLPAPYLTFRRDSVTSGIDFGGSTPRFSTGYAPLQGRGAILVETHMLKSYEVRVKATYDLLVALLEELRARPRLLTRAVADAEAEIIARGRQTDPAKREFVLNTRTTNRSVPFPFKGVVTTWTKSEVTGALLPHYSSAPWDTIVPLFREVEPTVTVRQPVGYLVPQEWTAAIDRLAIHGVKSRRLAKAWTDTVEVQRIDAFTEGPTTFEGHHATSVGEVVLERRARTFRRGDVWVPLDQRSAAIAVHSFEAKAPDGLVAWNAFDTIFEFKEYGEAYVVDSLAQRMMAKDPALKQEFAARLASDSTFAKSPGARVDFFYRRSPWADPEQNRVPIVRALRPVPESVLEPDPGAPATPAPRRR